MIPQVELSGRVLESQPLEDLGSYDAVLIVTDHSSVDYARVVREAKLVVDTRNATRGIGAEKGRVVKL
jgi:UDP-N-acetyl-D-glucosamine dehydrogenase